MPLLTDVSVPPPSDNDNPQNRNYRTPPDYPTADLPPMTAAEEARFWRELSQPETVDVPIPRIDPSRSYSSVKRGLLIRAIGTRTCENPVGLVLEAGTNRDLVTAPCRVCGACRAWDRALDEYRMTEAAGNALAVAIIPEDRWATTRKRLARAETPYLSVPIEGDRRAVIIPAGAPIPAVAVGDLVEVLANLDRERNRGDKRRLSSSGLRSRATMEAIAFPVSQAEEQPRQVVGFFNPKGVTDAAELVTIAATVEAAANSLGVETTRAGLTVTVDGHRHMPRLERLWTWLGVHWLDQAIPWHEGGPPPTIDGPGWEVWASARFGHAPVWDDVPMSAYAEVG